MVVVDYPDNTCRKFFVLEGTMFGPVDDNGSYKAQQIELQLNTELFQPVKRIYGENEITHSSFHGKVFYYPILADCIPIPSVQNPRSIKVPVLESPYLVTAMYGFGCPDFGAFVDNSSTQYRQQATRRNNDLFDFVFVVAQKTRPTRCYVYRHQFHFNRWVSPGKIELLDTYWYSVYDIAVPFDMTRTATCDQIFSCVDLVTRWTKYAPGTKQLAVYTTDPSAVSSDKLRQNLEVFCDQLMQENFPLPLANYGDMAAAAVKSKRLVDSNIIEFIRDLRDVKSLIPKLENLKSLKGISSTYLGVKYGILPTKSDISSIVDAFKVRKPFFDKNGFTVFNSSHTDRLITGDCQWNLEQHIKVPIANEDSEFEKLLDELDKFGVGLTFENVWDLLRYSFVVDWFVNVGGFLRRIDNNLRLLRYNIPYVTMSDKRSVTGQLPQSTTLLTMGLIEWRYYHRWVESQCPLPPLTLSTTSTISNHWLEAGALLIQRAL